MCRRIADDLMEPFRPIVDRAVVLYCDQHDAAAPVDKEAKAALIGVLMARFPIGKPTGGGQERRSLFDIAGRIAADLVQVFAGEKKGFVLPEL